MLSLGPPHFQSHSVEPTARYFFTNVLPETRALVALIKAGKAQMMAFEADEF